MEDTSALDARSPWKRSGGRAPFEEALRHRQGGLARVGEVVPSPGGAPAPCELGPHGPARARGGRERRVEEERLLEATQRVAKLTEPVAREPHTVERGRGGPVQLDR